jgi:p-cumate 2,3-dioxygenase beta subunit
MVEEFLYAEAELLDRWDLHAWLALFSDDGRYLVAPLGLDDARTADPDNVLFLVADDHARVSHRVARLLKKGAHAEYPHSRTRHSVSNVMIEASDEDGVRAAANFSTYRSRNRETVTYVGRTYYDLARRDGGLAIREKRVCLDMEFLASPGSLAIIL